MSSIALSKNHAKNPNVLYDTTLVVRIIDKTDEVIRNTSVNELCEQKDE